MIRRFLSEFRAEILVSYLVIGLVLAGVLYIVSAIWSEADVFSLGQLILEFLLIPIALIGFLFAAEEFRKSQVRPDLDVYWLRDSTGLTKELSIEHIGYFTGHPEEGLYTGSLAIMNQGNAICEWFQVEIKIPLQLSGLDDFMTAGADDSEQVPIIDWHRSIGEDANWEETVEGFRYYRILFRSNGLIAAYIDEPLVLGFAGLWPSENVTNSKYKVPYRIMTNTGARNEGELLVSVKVIEIQ